MNKNNLLLYIFSFIFIVSISVVNIGCGCPKCDKENSFEIPEFIIYAGNKFISEKTGEEFREKFIDIDFNLSKYNEPYYNLVYRFRMHDKIFVDEKIEFTLDSNGNIVDLFDIYGIPDCVINESNCEFNINENEVINIAEELNFEKGIKGWEIGFVFHPSYKIYVWIVLSTFNESEGSNGLRANGKELIINPFDGSIIAQNEWNIR